MDENQYNSLIEKIATMMEKDGLSVDEQNVQKLQKYERQAKSDSNLYDEDAMKLVYESLLYLKLKNLEQMHIHVRQPLRREKRQPCAERMGYSIN